MQRGDPHMAKSIDEPLKIKADFNKLFEALIGARQG
jgi:hypothetical protein